MIFTNIFCRSTGMTTTSVQTFNKLAQESVELIKTRETIKKLENIIRGMAKKIQIWSSRYERKFQHIFPYAPFAFSGRLR